MRGRGWIRSLIQPLLYPFPNAVARCESVVMSDHPTHRHQLPGGGVPHEASFVGTPGGPGLTRLRGAGFLLGTPRSRLRRDPRYRRVPSKAGSSLGSTGPSATDGEQVLCRIHVPVDDQAASLAREDALI